MKILRCQLPRANSFYSSEPPKGNVADKPLTPGGSFGFLFYCSIVKTVIFKFNDIIEFFLF